MGVGNPDMADVAGRAVGAAVDPALGQQAGTDAGTDLAIDEVREGFATPGALTKGKQVDVVIHPHRCVKAVLEGCADIESIPPGHDRRCHRLSRGEVNRAGEAHHHTPDGHLVILFQHVVNERHHGVNGLLGALGDIPGAVRVCQDVAVQGSDANPYMSGSEGTYDDPALLRAEAGCAATGGGAEFSIPEKADLNGLVHTLADNAPAQPGDLADFRARCRLARSHQVDDPQQARHFIRLCSKAECGLCRHDHNSHT
ncbi:hypothetical protein SRABI128_06151 [Microbacterium sp. Bi128]|nr:hypothetical protein SRABI128_06151 [Microbacterium sp. Bi128]